MKIRFRLGKFHLISNKSQGGSRRGKKRKITDCIKWKLRSNEHCIKGKGVVLMIWLIEIFAKYSMKSEEKGLTEFDWESLIGRSNYRVLFMRKMRGCESYLDLHVLTLQQQFIHNYMSHNRTSVNKYVGDIFFPKADTVQTF